MDENRESARLRGLLMASRNQIDWLWSIAETNSGMNRGRMESALKLMGAIDYALGIETYSAESSHDSAPGFETSSHPNRPLDIG